MHTHAPANQDQDTAEHGGWTHWAFMVLCCLPMIAAIVLIGLGVWKVS